MSEPRTWTIADNEPADRPDVTCAYGYTWWRADDGWRSDALGYFDKSVTWWWLSMYRGPLREVIQR